MYSPRVDYATLMQIGLGFLGGIVGSAIGYGVLALKLFRLQMLLGAVREGLLSVRNTRANQVRQERKLDEEQFLKEMVPSKKERFANDPPWG